VVLAPPLAFNGSATQSLEPRFLLGLIGTTEVVPYPKRFCASRQDDFVLDTNMRDKF
jgi:hypothetical protein